MRYFFTTFRNIKLRDFEKDFQELIPGLNITNKLSVKEKLLTPKNRDSIGIIETQHILNSDTLVFYEYEDNEEIFEGLTNLQILEIVLRWIDDLLKNSWLHKDNCIVCDTAYLIDSSLDYSEASSLRLQYIHTYSTGGFEIVEYTESELVDLIKIHDKTESYLYGKESGSLRFMLEKNFSRIGRALLFVKQARESRNLAYKISNYCSALETLFTTDNMELSHKLAERTAFFLADEDSKSEIFSIIKKAYTVRSKLTHGASLDQKQIDNLSEISSQTDRILRKAFMKILDDDKLRELFDSNNKRIDDYFMGLIMK